jgi:hypothetical protein
MLEHTFTLGNRQVDISVSKNSSNTYYLMSLDIHDANSNSIRHMDNDHQFYFEYTDAMGLSALELEATTMIMDELLHLDASMMQRFDNKGNVVIAY